MRTRGFINYDSSTEIGTLQNSEYTKLTRIVQNMRDTVSSVCHYKIRRYVPVPHDTSTKLLSSTSYCQYVCLNVSSIDRITILTLV